MRLDHEFTVPAPIDEVWKAVIDPERVAPCMPGATLISVDGDTFKGTVKVKLGPVSLLYKGSGEFLEKNEASREITIKASGKDSRGAGTAAANVTVTLTAEGDTTKGAVATDLNVTGKPAQFGRGMISEVGGKILDSFAENLSAELASDPAQSGAGSAPEGAAGPGKDTTPGQAPPGTGDGSGIATGAAAAAAPQQPESPQAQNTQSQNAQAKNPRLESVKPGGARGEAEAIDLFDYAGASVAKRIAPVVAGVVALFGVLAIIRMLRGKKASED